MKSFGLFDPITWSGGSQFAVFPFEIRLVLFAGWSEFLKISPHGNLLRKRWPRVSQWPSPPVRRPTRSAKQHLPSQRTLGWIVFWTLCLSPC